MSRRAIIPAGVAAALLIATPIVADFEGKRNDPYRDIVGIPTVCYGETRVPMRRYSDAECTQMLNKAVAEFAAPVAESTPTISNKPHQLAAATSLAYNIGLDAYSKSSVRRLFLAKDFKGACKAFLSWNKVRRNGKLEVSKGLDNRRKKEMAVCLTGL